MSVLINGEIISPLYVGNEEVVRRYIKNNIVYQKIEDHRFRFKNVGNGTNILKLVKEGAAPTITLMKSNNGYDYTLCDIYNGILLQKNETVYLKGTNDAFANDVFSYNHFTSTDRIICRGSIMDLCDGGTGTTECKFSYQFYGLFEGMDTLLTAPELPALILQPHVYQSLFEKCTSLKYPPKLPARDMDYWCYSSMYAYCSSLVEASDFYPIYLADHCFEGMYFECNSLVHVPEELPATRIFDYSYSHMFAGCRSLEKSPRIEIQSLNGNGVRFQPIVAMFQRCSKLNYVEIDTVDWNIDFAEWWLKDVAPTGTFVKPKELTNIPLNSPSGIPSGWKVIEK